MAGKPETRRKREKVASDIAARGGDDWLFGLISGDGDSKPVSVTDIAKLLKCYRAHLELYLNEPERAELFAAAKKAKAEWHAARSGGVLDDLADDPTRILTAPEVSLANSRSNWHKWMASVTDRDTFGEKQQAVNVNVNLNDLHFNALLSHGKVPQLPAPEIPTIQAEVIEDAVSELAK
jgi:hypothetical protein